MWFWLLSYLIPNLLKLIYKADLFIFFFFWEKVSNLSGVQSDNEQNSLQRPSVVRSPCTEPT